MENRELLMQLKEELYNLCLLDDSAKGDAYFDGINFKYIRVKSLSEFPDVFVCSNEKMKPLKLLAKKRKSLTKIKRENRREREIQKLKREIRKAEEKRLAQEEKQRKEEAARLEAEIIKAEEKQRLEKLQEEWEKKEREKERKSASPDSLNFALYKFMKGEAKFYKGKLYVEIFGIFHVWYIKGKKLIARQVNNHNYEGYIKGKEYIEKYHSYFLPKEVK